MSTFLQQNLGLLISGIALVLILLVAYARWRDGRRQDDPAVEENQQQAKGGGGPTKPVLPK